MRPLVVVWVLSLCRFAAAQVVSPWPVAPQGPAAVLGMGEDVVTLRDGTILRGHVTELRPNDHVEIVLLDGRTQIVQWGDLAASSGPSFPAAARRNLAQRYLQPSPGRVPIELDAPRTPVSVGVMRAYPAIGQEAMTLDQDGDVSQLTMDYQSRNGVVVCSATPCRIYARPGALDLQVSGQNVLSYTAQLSVPEAGAHVRLRAPNAAQRRTGTLLTMNSLGALVAGGVLMGLGAAFDSGPASSHTHDSSSLYYGLGGAVMGVGAVMAVTGIILWARNRRGIDSVAPLADGVRF